MFDRYSCILYDFIKTPVKDAWKNHEKVTLTALYTSVDAILFFTISDVMREKWNDVNVNKNQDKMLIPGQPCIIVWRHVYNLRPIFRIFNLSKNHVQTARESHDSNMILVVWKRLLVDLTVASNSCVHRYLFKNESTCMYRLNRNSQLGSNTHWGRVVSKTMLLWTVLYLVVLALLSNRVLTI